MSNEQILIGPKRRFIKLSHSKEILLIKTVNDFLENTKHAFIVKDVADHANKELNENYPEHFIRKIMKNKLNLSYKKVKPRPNNIDMNKLKCIRALFAFKFAKLLNEDTLIINIDQSSINRHIKSNRSWGLKGAEIESKNIIFANSYSLCMAILSNGSSFCLCTNQTITTKTIVLFLLNLSKWLIQNNNFAYHEILLILDNCSIQKSKIAKDLICKLKWKAIYLHVYSPMYAPIENCFSLIKSYLKKRYKAENIKINLQQNYSTLIQALKSISSKTIKNLFANLLSRIRRNISNFE